MTTLMGDLLTSAARAGQAGYQKPKATVIGTQVGGSHYTDCPIQPIQYIWANNLGFSEGNVVKYITRWKTKGGIKDLEKAKHHIALLIEHTIAREAEDAAMVSSLRKANGKDATA